MKLRKFSFIFLTWNFILVLIIAAFVAVPALKRRSPRALQHLANLPAVIAHAAERNPWTLAVEKVKEDRGEPVGRQAKIEIPTQLRHYADTRRFLAMQVAEVNQHHVATPQDLVDLAAMIESGALVPLQSVNENYILFGVGGNADRQAFTRYKNGKSISLHNEAGLRAEYQRLEDSRAAAANESADLRKQLGTLKRRERTQRAKLQSQIAQLEKGLKANKEEKALLDRYYGNEETRQQFFADYETLTKLAAKESAGLGLRTFNLEDPSDRQRMKVRLLSSLRPEALQVLEELAASYHEKFDRPLPITSLVRPDEYQQQLSKTNPNATRIETPPHSTGLAFDILYRYMTTAEQDHVMSHLARLKDEGRIEVLRENRDHYHVFAFVDGARPGEHFVAAVLNGAGSGRSAEAQSEKVVARSTKSAAPRSRRASVAHHASKKSRTAKSTSAKPRRRARR